MVLMLIRKFILWGHWRTLLWMHCWAARVPYCRIMPFSIIFQTDDLRFVRLNQTRSCRDTHIPKIKMCWYGSSNQWHNFMTWTSLQQQKYSNLFSQMFSIPRLKKKKKERRLEKGYFFNFKTGFVINIVKILGVKVKCVYSIVWNYATGSFIVY